MRTGSERAAMLWPPHILRRGRSICSSRRTAPADAANARGGDDHNSRSVAPGLPSVDATIVSSSRVTAPSSETAFPAIPTEERDSTFIPRNPWFRTKFGLGTVRAPREIR
jgi:hypothetical protein